MKKRHRAMIGALLSMALMGAFVFSGCVTALAADGMVSYTTVSDPALGSYKCLTVTGLTPYVFMPTGAGSDDESDFTNVTAMAEEYGEVYGIVAASSGGIFYNAGTDTQYCYYYKEADGVVIANGVVLKSTESLDHTECDILVIDEDGNAGWADYFADADALAAGTGYYYDAYGNVVTGKRVVSAVTGFVPIVVGGVNVYDPADEALHGYDNFAGHYSQGAARQIFGVRADGTYVILSSTTGWTLDEAAEAALSRDCVFAYNLDGGGSAETVVGIESEGGYDVRTVRSQMRGTRSMPTFIVFTVTDEAPVSAVPTAITAAYDGTPLSAGADLSDIAAALTVTEYFENTDGDVSQRRVYSALEADHGGSIEHTVRGGASFFDGTEVKKQSVSPDGVLYYVKTDADTALSLKNNSNTRADGAYYDYSTGYALAAADDLTTPGQKTFTVSYVPGAGYEPLTTEVSVYLSH